MCREGYNELQVGQPQVIYKEIGWSEVWALLRSWQLTYQQISQVWLIDGDWSYGRPSRYNGCWGWECWTSPLNMPSRGNIGLRTNVLTASQGEAIMAHRFKDYQPFKGRIVRRTNGSMIALEVGNCLRITLSISCRIVVSSSSIQVRKFMADRLLVSMFTTTTSLSTWRRQSSWPTSVHLVLTWKARVIPKTEMSLRNVLSTSRATSMLR